MIDRLELEQRIYNTVIVNPENNSVEVRLINPQYQSAYYYGSAFRSKLNY